MPTYRGPGPWGPGKGSNLTPAELDANTHELRSELDDVIANPPTANSIETITQVGYTWTITLTDGTVLGPYPIPVAQFRWRGEWTPNTLYYELDVFRVTDVGLFSVMADHLSDAVFDGQAIGGSPPVALYNELIEVASTHKVSTQSGDYTLVESDADAWIRCSSAGSPADPIEITVPDEITVPFVTGTTVAFEDTTGAGVSVVGAGGVTINCATGFSAGTGGQYAVVQIKKVGADEWTIYGNLAP